MRDGRPCLPWGALSSGPAGARRAAACRTRRGFGEQVPAPGGRGRVACASEARLSRLGTCARKARAPGRGCAQQQLGVIRQCRPRWRLCRPPKQGDQRQESAQQRGEGQAAALAEAGTLSLVGVTAVSRVRAEAGEQPVSSVPSTAAASFTVSLATGP